MAQDPRPDQRSGRGACLITALMVLIAAMAFFIPLYRLASGS